MKSTFVPRCNVILKVRFVRCTKRYGGGIKNNARTNFGTTKVNFDQTEVKKVVPVADGGKLKVLKTKGKV